MTLLALDSAGPVCSVALDHDGTVSERMTNEPRAHANHILALVSDLLGDAGLVLHDVDQLAFGAGPGGLTGLRIAASVVQGFGLVTGATLWSVSNLEALARRVAQHVVPATRLLIAHDAGMGALCVQWFDTADAAQVVARGAAQVLSPHELTWDSVATVVAGSGSGKLTLPSGAGWFDSAPSYARAADLITVLCAGGGRCVELGAAQPTYLRHPVDGKLAQ